jgi:glycosyltransferase involved in cell wall biosynthesis
MNIRVLSVNHLLDPVTGGGTAERTFQLCRLLAQADVDCTLLTLDVGITPQRRLELAGVRIVALTCLFRRFFIPRISWHALRAEVRAAHVVHMMGHWTLLNALVFLAARREGRPYVVCPAGFLTVTGRSAFLKRIYNAIVGWRIIRGAAGHIAITTGEIPAFSDYGVAADRIVVIPNGVPPSEARIRNCAEFLSRHGLQGRKFVLFLGRLSYIKGPELLLEAFANIAGRLPEFDLVYAGPDDGLLAELRRYALRHGLGSRVHFIGYIGGDDKACALQSCELLAIPSRLEAMSIVALEAGSHGKPVLLTDQCGFNEVELVRGGIVTKPTVRAIEEGLMQMAANPGDLTQMGARLKAFVQQEYTWSIVIEKHLALFKEIANRAR